MTQRARESAELAKSVAAAISDRLRELGSPSSAPGVRADVGEELTTAAGSFRVTARHTEGGAEGLPVALVVLVLERAPSEAELVGWLIERYGLTPREAAAARLLARRASTAEIARALGISAHTARHHVERVLSKLGVRSRAEAADKLAAAVD